MHRPNFKDVHSKLNGWDATGVTRMTSQLAHGIHRQLDQMKREEQGLKVGQPQQHHQQQPLGMVDDRYVKTPDKGYYPPPPPNNVYMQQQHQQDTSSGVESSNVYVNLPHNSHDASTASYHTRPPAYISHQQQQHQQMMNQAMNQQQHQQQMNYMANNQQQIGRPQQSHSSVYSRSDGSVQSNSMVNNKHATMTSSEDSSLKAAINHNQQYNNPHNNLHTTSNGFPTVPPPMSVYENISRSDDRPIQSPLSPGINNRNRSHMNGNQHPSEMIVDSYPTIDRSYKEEQPTNQPTDASEQSQLSRCTSDRIRTNSTQQQVATANGGMKAPSCDSGLPNEEVEFGSDGADSARPLLQNNISVVAASTASSQAPIV